jgi:prepilin-type processing-associated H-X9-DG protein
MRTNRRQGFSLFQLLVVLALLIILFALLLPAVAKVRLAAARMQSQNNLKQLALAVHNYHDANGFMPSGNDANNFSASAHLLPYIEQDNLYKLIDFKKPMDDPANAAVRKTVIKVFLNPQDPVGMVSADYGATSYLFSAGSKYPLKDNDGVFYQDSKLKLTDIPDGTSNTLMAGETLKGDGGVRAMTVRRQLVRLKAADLAGLKPESGVKEWKADKQIASDRCASWMDGRFLQGTFTASRLVNDEKPDVDCGGAGGLSGLRGLQGGVNVALCDGSVRFLSAGITFTTLKAAATRNGGEVLGADF